MRMNACAAAADMVRRLDSTADIEVKLIIFTES
jgi:hypothetical protein